MSSPASSAPSQQDLRTGASYDDDFVSWTEDQARLLRTAARTGRLPDGLDLDLIAEELEDVGRAERNAAISLIRQIFVHVIKSASAPSAQSQAHWTSEILTFRAQLMDVFQNSMAQRIELQRIWEDASAIAEAALGAHGQELSGSVRKACPIAIQDLVDPNTAVADILAKAA